jgi:hypothetical protein
MKGINMVPFVTYMPFILGALPFIVLIVIIVVIFRYHLGKKQLEHQQIMAAIEKGAPLPELRPIIQQKKEVDWIRSLTVGIAFLLMGIGMVIISLISFCYSIPDEDASFGLIIAAVVFLAIGAAGVCRGILRQKYDKALSDKSALNANNGQ